MATTMGIMVAATMVLGRKALRNMPMANHDMIWRVVLVPTPISEPRAMRRSSPHRVQQVVSTLADSSRMTSSAAYAGRIRSMGAKSNIATVASGRNPVTARCTGRVIHHSAIQNSSPRLQRIS